MENLFFPVVFFAFFLFLPNVFDANTLFIPEFLNLRYEDVISKFKHAIFS